MLVTEFKLCWEGGVDWCAHVLYLAWEGFHVSVLGTGLLLRELFRVRLRRRLG